MAFRRTGVFTGISATVLGLLVAYGQHGGPGPQGGHGGGAMAAPPPEEVVVPDKGVTLPMLDFDGRAVVEVKINGKGPYRFILGTTANLTLIDSGLQKELGLPLAEGVMAGPSGGNAPTIVTVGELRMGDVAVRGFMGAVMPVASVWSTGGPNPPRGIVSANLFSGYLLTYDYPKKRVSIQKGELPKDDSITTFSYSESRPTVPLRIGGKTIRVQMDTGSGAGLMLASKFEKEVPLAAPPQGAGKTRTTTGEFPVTKGTLSAPIELGKYKLGPEVSFSDSRGQVSGTVGNSILRDFVVTIDIWNHLVRLAQ